MPNRILRDWTDSATIDKLSFQEEVLFTRLIMKADDYGNFYRNAALIRSLLFPRKDGLRSVDIDRWLDNLQAAGLIRTYPAKGDSFLHVVNFGQRLRQKKRMFPEPPENIDSELTATCQPLVDNPPLEEKRRETEVETETNSPPAKKFVKPSITELENFFSEIGLDDFTAQAQASLFFSHYESNGWKVGKNSMKEWRAAAQGWKNRMNNFKNSSNGANNYNGFKQNGKAGRSAINDEARSNY